MKKTVILAAAFVSAMLLLTGCSNNEEPFVQKSYEADGTQISEINMDVRDRQIEVSLSEDNQIHIDYFENGKEYYDISVSDDRILNMKAEGSKEWKDYIGGKAAEGSRKISLQIPNALLSKLTIKTTNEDITLSALIVEEDVSLSTNGGNIIFDKVNVGKALNLTVKNGDITGSIIGGYDDFSIACEMKKGESNLPLSKKEGDKKLQVNANNGDVTIDFLK